MIWRTFRDRAGQQISVKSTPCKFLVSIHSSGRRICSLSAQMSAKSFQRGWWLDHMPANNFANSRVSLPNLLDSLFSRHSVLGNPVLFASKNLLVANCNLLLFLYFLLLQANSVLLPKSCASLHVPDNLPCI